MDPNETRERRTNRLLYLAFIALIFVVAAIAVPKMADGSVTSYERKAPRDLRTGNLKGMSPRELGPVGAPRAVLFVHGFSGSPSNYNDLPDALAADGWRVRCMLVPGHGTSPRDFEVTTGEQMLDGVLTELRALKAKYPKVALAGHSLGGALATLAAAREPVDALLLYAPFFGSLTADEHLPVSVRAFAEFASPWLRWLPRSEGAEPVAYAPNRKHIKSYGWIPSRAGLTALNLGQQVQDENAFAKVACPVLLLHSKGDRVNSWKSTADAAARFPNPATRAAWFQKSDHILFWDYDRLPTLYETRVFLDQHLPG